MKIFFDYQIFVRQKYGGISRYFQQLIVNLNEIFFKDNVNQHQIILSSLLSDNRYISQIPGGPNFCNRNIGNKFIEAEFKGKFRLLDNLNKFFLAPQVALSDYDIFHPTYYDPYFLKALDFNRSRCIRGIDGGRRPRPRLVITVYDMIHERYPQSFCKRDRTIANKRLLLSRADKIIAISHNTKKDILYFYPEIDPQKIAVIHLATSMNLSDKSPSILSKLPDTNLPYILFVGRREIYKNFNRTLEAITPLLLDLDHLQLLCFGGGAFDCEEINLIKKLGVENKVKQINGDDSLLQNLYQHALCFLFPSCYEGFGIPILEAFACECPLVCSNTSSFPEVAGDGANGGSAAALYFNPEDPESIRAAVEKIVKDTNESKSIRNELVAKGKNQLENFSWEKMARQTLDVYFSLL